MSLAEVAGSDPIIFAIMSSLTFAAGMTIVLAGVRMMPVKSCLLLVSPRNWSPALSPPLTARLSSLRTDRSAVWLPGDVCRYDCGHGFAVLVCTLYVILPGVVPAFLPAALLAFMVTPPAAGKAILVPSSWVSSWQSVPAGLSPHRRPLQVWRNLGDPSMRQSAWHLPNGATSLVRAA